MDNPKPAKPLPPRKYLIIHGHFYQPPRENPWIEEIEIQNSAHPFHDWNQKINLECYRPNSMARIYDSSGRIIDLVNNFELISFNFGPTLFSWLKTHDPYTYEKIIEADRVSRKLFSGHGNAIAQAYNHMILPLANERDRLTQIRWGIYDFKYRFGRDPEAMWLPETAVNHATLRDLINEGLKFVILSPHQAQAIRPLGKKEWQDVSHGNIDTTRPYRYFLPNEPQKHIDIFFYHDQLARDISFGDALRNADSLIEQLESVYSPDKKYPKVVNVATDGETFGHHKTFGDLTLAYTLKIRAKQVGFIITNYAEYLSQHPPKYEVKIKVGPKGEGTSWSCSHGVERWRSDCGCHTGGSPDWNQAWRQPLRKALDTIRDRLALIFEQQASKYLKDAGCARDAYIRIILDRSPQNVERYFADWQTHELTPEEKTLALKLLEMERHAMLMYTSCGWFFSEISGIETVQIIRYAACAIQLAQEFTNENLEALFVSMLAEVPSNIPLYGNGAVIYKKLVEPYKVDFAKVANHYAISSIFEDYQDVEQLHCYRVQRLDYRHESFGKLTLVMGHLKISADMTQASAFAYFALLRVGLYDFRCSVKVFNNHSEYLKIKNELFSQLNRLHVLKLIDLLEEHFGKQYFSLKDLFLDGRRKIVNLLCKDVLKRLGSAYQEFYEENRRMAEVFKEVELPLPKEYLTSAEYTLSRQLEEEIADLESPLSIDKFERIFDILNRAQELNIELKRETPQRVLSDFLMQRITKLKPGIELDLLLEIKIILQVAQRLKLNIDKRIAQDIYFRILKEHKNFLKEQGSKTKYSLVAKEMLFIGSELGFNMQGYLGEESAAGLLAITDRSL
jgi:alpha-amylase/alpha-mannosidase (GH57 family)